MKEYYSHSYFSHNLQKNDPDTPFPFPFPFMLGKTIPTEVTML